MPHQAILRRCLLPRNRGYYRTSTRDSRIMTGGTTRAGLALMHGDLTREIIGAFYQIYSALGHGFVEGIYQRSLPLALSKRGIKAQREVPMTVTFLDTIVGEYRADLIVDGEGDRRNEDGRQDLARSRNAARELSPRDRNKCGPHSEFWSSPDFQANVFVVPPRRIRSPPRLVRFSPRFRGNAICGNRMLQPAIVLGLTFTPEPRISPENNRRLADNDGENNARRLGADARRLDSRNLGAF